MSAKTVSIVTACYNEKENIEELYERIRVVMASIGRYRYEHIFIDNASRDNTVAVLKRIAARHTNVRIIVNARNFGHIRSPIHAVHQAIGDAVVSIAADLQEPPEMLSGFIREWENGYPMAVAVEKTSNENPVMFWLRTRYYRLVRRLSSIETSENVTGFGLYDRKVVDIIKSFDDPCLYFRGMIAEIGLPHVEIAFNQPRRKRGITKNNLYTLYDMAMLGITNLSKVPLPIVTFMGFACSLLCVLVAVGYFVYKLLFGSDFSVGVAPLVIGIFFFGSIQLMSMGILDEYLGAIHTHILHRPSVVEREPVNFQHAPGIPLRRAENDRPSA